MATEFELRGMKSDDMFLMFGILSKIGFKEFKDIITAEKIKELSSASRQDEGNDLSTYVGFSLVLEVSEIIMRNLPVCKGDIYSLLSALSGMTVKQISDLDMVTFTEMIVAVVQKEDFKDFFKVVANLFK